jgi:hypothetical protein
MCQLQTGILCLNRPAELGDVLSAFFFQLLNQFSSLGANVRIYFSRLFNYTNVRRLSDDKQDYARVWRICNQLHSSVTCWLPKVCTSYQRNVEIRSKFV